MIKIMLSAFNGKLTGWAEVPKLITTIHMVMDSKSPRIMFSEEEVDNTLHMKRATFEMTAEIGLSDSGPYHIYKMVDVR